MLSLTDPGVFIGVLWNEYVLFAGTKMVAYNGLLQILMRLFRQIFLSGKYNAQEKDRSRLKIFHFC
jgi:hypothetical protein